MKDGRLFSNWIFSDPDAINKNLQIYRVIYVLYVFIIVMPQHLWVSHYPDTFFLPRIGITLFFTGFPSITFFYVLNFLLIISLLALLIGYKKFYASIAVTMLLLIGNSWAYSFGKINHDIFLVIIPLVLAVIFWKEESSKTYRWVAPIFALIISLAMLTAALSKITTGWMDPNASALAGHLIQNYSLIGRETILASQLLSLDNFYVFKFLDYSTVALESAFIFSIFSLRHFRLVCAIACLFHFGVQLTMEISFTPNVMAYAFFVEWSYLYNIGSLKTALNKMHELSCNIRVVGLFLAAISLWSIYILFGNPFSFDLGLTKIFGGNLAKTSIMTTAVFISLAYIFQLLPLRNSRKIPSLRFKN